MLVVDADLPGRVSAEVRAPSGQVTALVGPNGSGKSTLLQVIAGLLPGRVTLDGRDLSGRLVRERRVGMVFQEQRLFPHLSVVDNVAFGPRSAGRPRPEARSVATEWLDRFGIADLARRHPGELSGGQAQRVAIARALASDPDVLLLDEPFTGLDPVVATSLRLELGQHLASYEGVTVLVTHDALDALTLAGRVVVLDSGRVAQTGPLAEVAAQPRTEHVARLLGLNVVRDGDLLRAFPPSAVAVSLGEPSGSPRLRWHAAIATVTPHGDALRLLVGREPAILADVTPAAATELGLTTGTDVWLAVKETAVRSYPAS